MNSQVQQQFDDIVRIIRSAPAATLTQLPPVWQQLSCTREGTGLSDVMASDYIEAAQLFRYHDTPMAMEALSVIGKDFALENYPDFTALECAATTPLATHMIAAVRDLFAEFSYNVPAAFYNVLLETAQLPSHTRSMDLFRNNNTLMRDRLWDAVLHGCLLVTPISLFVHSVLSQHHIRFSHIMDCSCISAVVKDAPFHVAIDKDLKRAYLQNMIAAAFEQYGTNAMTSRHKRGF